MTPKGMIVRLNLALRKCGPDDQNEFKLHLSNERYFYWSYDDDLYFSYQGSGSVQEEFMPYEASRIRDFQSFHDDYSHTMDLLIMSGDDLAVYAAKQAELFDILRCWGPGE